MIEVEQIKAQIKAHVADDNVNVVVNPEAATAICAWIDKRLIEIQDQSVA